MKKATVFVVVVCFFFISCTTLRIPERDPNIDSLIVLSLEFKGSDESGMAKYFYAEINDDELIQIKPGLNVIKVSDPEHVAITFVGMKNSTSKYANWITKLDDDLVFTPEPNGIIIAKKKIIFGIRQYKNVGNFYGDYEMLQEKDIKNIESKIMKAQKKDAVLLNISIQ